MKELVEDFPEQGNILNLFGSGWCSGLVNRSVPIYICKVEIIYTVQKTNIK